MINTENKLSDQEILRRTRLDEFAELGIDPYPAEEWVNSHSTKELIANYNAETNPYPEVSVAGRIMSIRGKGAASFVDIMDSSGRMQCYFKRDEICPGEDKTLYNTVFKKMLDIGDIIGV